jgi:hypothetical protein
LAVGALILAIAIVIVVVLVYRPASATPQKAATLDSSLVPYKNMAEGDLNAVLTAQSAHCDTIDDTGCPAAAAKVAAPLQAWLDDLNRASTPPVFAYVDLQLRRHVALTIVDLNAMVAAVHAQNQTDLTTALNAAVGERDFIEMEVSAIYNSQQAKAADYRSTIALGKSVIEGCTECVPAAGVQFRCNGTQPLSKCTGQIESTRFRLEQFQAGLVSTRAPSSLTSVDAHLQRDLYIADVALGATEISLSASNATEFQFANSSYLQARAQVFQDIQEIQKP